MDDVQLDVIELGAELRVSEKLRLDIKWEEEFEPFFKGRLLHSYMALAGQRFEPVRVEYPADWWQALKARWFPAWAARRWPVRYHTVSWSPEVVYPLIALPEDARWEIMNLRDSERPTV
jgi:hypothetical protein